MHQLLMASNGSQPAPPPAGNNNCGQRYTVTAKPGKTQHLRLINAATLVYMTVCIQGHTLTVVALDAAPVEPQDFFECVDINTGQRCAAAAAAAAIVLYACKHLRGTFLVLTTAESCAVVFAL
jgi:hypothetical protein